MGSQPELDTLLRSILGNNHTYFQPPASIRMEYPCIRYEISAFSTKKADDSKYLMRKRYQLMYISRSPSTSVVENLLQLPYCSYDRYFVADDLHHHVLTIYF